MTSPNVNSTIVACRVHAMSCGLRPSTTTLVPPSPAAAIEPRRGLESFENCQIVLLFSSLASATCRRVLIAVEKTRRRHAKNGQPN